MIIGVPKEVKTDEHRVAITPAGVKEMVRSGHKVIIEKSAGVGSSITDADFVNVGATIIDNVDDVWATADMVMKVKEPIAQEYPRLGARKDQVLFTYLHLAAEKACTDAMIAGGNVGIAYETVRLADNSLPLLTPMSEVAGRMAPLMGAHHLMRPGGGKGSLIGGVAGTAKSNVVIIGGGVAGFNAAQMALGLHANVTILDRNLERLRHLDATFDGKVQTMASSALSLEEACLGADIVIGAVLVVGAKAPKLVSNDLVSRMKHGSVLVDISVDQGGCFEATKATTHSNPTFEINGSVFYCVANMPGAVPNTSTYALTNATLPYALKLANEGWKKAVADDGALREGVNVVNGAVTYAPVSEAHGMAFTPVESFL
ncbi:MAG: alanine dehydrogenase [Actinomycetota bacterium]